MAEPVTREEHEIFKQLMESENERLAEEDRRQNQRINVLEKTVQQISSIATSVEKLAVNMENMVTVQKQQGDRLKTLEERDGERWRQVTGYVITAVISAILGFVASTLGF